MLLPLKQSYDGLQQNSANRWDNLCVRASIMTNANSKYHLYDHFICINDEQLTIHSQKTNHHRLYPIGYLCKHAVHLFGYAFKLAFGIDSFSAPMHVVTTP